jgi:hypothetical protein
VEPAFITHEGDEASALALVISLNVQRRELTAAQRAVVAARVLEANGDTHGGDRRSSGKSSHLKRGDVASVFKVSDKSVQQAKALLADAPDLAEHVEKCLSSLAEAYEQLQERRKEAAQRAKDGERVAKYAEAISNGEMTRRAKKARGSTAAPGLVALNA